MSTPKVALVIGGDGGLGSAIVETLVKENYKTYATCRKDKPKGNPPKEVTFINHIDLTAENASADTLYEQLKDVKIDYLYFTAAVMFKEDINSLDWQKALMTYTCVTAAPAFIIGKLFTTGILADGSRVGLVTTEGGSIALRTKDEGGGMYSHHASKAGANMIGRLLSLDLMDRKIPLAILHPGFMRTDMTKGVGFDKFYDSGGAVEPSVAADALVKFLKDFPLEKTGTFWAPLGPKDIGQAENVLGKNLPTPLELPW